MYDKTQAYDQTKDAEPTSALEDMTTYLSGVLDSDRWYTKALWYAYGRLYCEPAVLTNAAGEVDDEATAVGFALAYQRMMLAWHTRQRTLTVDVADAWTNYTATAGGSIEHV